MRKLVLPMVFLAVLAALGHSDPAIPQPRVCGTYSSWSNGSYRYADSLDALYAGLGWAYTRVENTHIDEIVADLDRFDIFCPPCLYNYDHAQPYEKHLDAWKRFLSRGGILIGCDANYGQQIGWITQLADGLGMTTTDCPDFAKSQTTKIKIVATDDPFAPTPDCTLPWAHTVTFGPTWKVLATCTEGKPVALRWDCGKGILIATNLYTESGFPTAEYLKRIWAAQWPKLMDRDLAVEIDRGASDSVGKTRLHVRVDMTGAAGPWIARLEVKHPGGQWQSQDQPFQMTGAEMPYSIVAGRTDVRLAIRAGTETVWWTSCATDTPDVPRHVADLRGRLQSIADDLKALPADDPLRKQWADLSASVDGTAKEADGLLAGEGSAQVRDRWKNLDAGLTQLSEKAVRLGGFVAVSARLARERPTAHRGGFAVVRSTPLDQLHRDAVPSGPLDGPVEIAAARGEAESVQLGIVPLGGDLTGVAATVEPFTNGQGGKLSGTALELYRVGYVHLKGPSAGSPSTPDWWPDPLLPAAKPFAITHACQPVWLDVFVPENARPGIYTGAITVRCGADVERVPVRLRVFDFALPHEHSLRQFFVFRAPLIAEKYGLGRRSEYMSKVPIDTTLRMCDVMYKRRIGVHIFGDETSPTPSSTVPYLGERKTADGWQFDFTLADKIWQHQRDAGMRTLFVGYPSGISDPTYWAFLEAYLKALVPHLKAKGWLQDAVWYMVDEAWQEEQVTNNIKLAATLDHFAPEIKRLFTAPRDKRLDGLAQIWVPCGLPDATPKDPAQQALLKTWRDHGAEMWWYICCGPTHPYPNFFVDYPATDWRMVFWLTRKYAKTGFLYWGTEYWGDPKQMTPGGPTADYPIGTPSMGNGDGTLGYWGPDFAFYPSQRMETIRDGLEDYEYFALLDRLAAKAEAKGVAADLVRDARKALAIDERVLRITDAAPNFAFTHDGAGILTARREMARIINALWRTVGP